LNICGKGSGAGVGATYWIRLTTSVTPPFTWSAGAASPALLASSAEPQSRPMRNDWDMLSVKTVVIIEFSPSLLNSNRDNRSVFIEIPSTDVTFVSERFRTRDRGSGTRRLHL